MKKIKHLKNSIAKKLILILVGSQVLFLGTLISLGVYFINSTVEDQFAKRLDAFSKQFESSVITAMISQDLGTLDSIGQHSIQLPDILEFKIFLKDVLVVSESRINEKSTSYKQVHRQISLSGINLGRLEYKISTDGVTRSKKNIYLILLLICFFEFLFAITLSFFIGKYIQKKTNFLISGIEKYAQGDLSFRYKEIDNNEFGIVANSFNLMTEKLQQLQIQTVQNSKMAALGEMAGSIAHEINNPLAIINSMAAVMSNDLVEKDFDQERFNMNLARIQATTKRIAKIISGLKTFSRNAENDPLEVSSFDKILEDSLALCSEKLISKNVKLILNNLLTHDVFIECRATQISQVIINLLNNAIDAIENLEEKWIKIETTSLDTTLKIKVIDSGKGIDSEITKKMMDPFYTTKDIGKGTGLGLSISKGIIDGHNGKIYYDSTNFNTCFVVELKSKGENFV